MKTHILIQDLTQEHVAIITTLKIITKIADSTNTKNPYIVKDVEAIIDFLDDFIINNHFFKEELLFQALSSIATDADIQEYNALIKEHKDEAEIVTEIMEALEKCKSISPSSSQVITDKLKKLVGLIDIHLTHEDAKIFPYIDRILTNTLEDALMLEYKNNQGKILNNADKEEYYQFILKIQEKYDLKEDLIFF